jgi:hypothetical protein
MSGNKRSAIGGVVRALVSDEFLARRGLLLLLASALLLALPARAEVRVIYSNAGKSYFEMSLPDDWRLATGFEVAPAEMPEGVAPQPRIISAMPEDDAPFWTGFWVPDQVPDLNAAVDYLEGLRGYLLEGERVTSARERTVNGMETLVYNGIGIRDDEPMEFVIALLQLPGSGVAIAAFIGEPGAKAAHQANLELMLTSIQPLAE